MKRTIRLLTAAALTLLLSSCAGQASPQETAAAKPSSAPQSVAAETQGSEPAAARSQSSEASAAETRAPETSAAETTPAASSADEAENPQALSPIACEYTDYIRDYPGIPGENLRFSAKASQIRITSAGYDDLQASLDKLNTSLRESADSAFKNQAEEFVREEPNEYLMALEPFSSELTFHMTRADSRVMSFSITDYSWYGGAHPYSYQSGYTLESATGRYLKLQDVVTDYDALYEETIRKLEEYEYSDGFFEEWRDTLKNEFYGDPDQQVNWNLDREGVNIWFNQYDIAPYVIGPVCIGFPAKEYESLIRQEYFPEDIPAMAEEGPKPGESVVVYDLCHQVGQYTDNVDNFYWYSYLLPEISGPDTEYVRKANREMGEWKSEYVDSQMDAMAEGTSLFTTDVRYSSAAWNGITSVMVRVLMDGDNELFRCYNFHADGTEVDNEEILALFGLTPEEFMIAAREQLEPYAENDPSKKTLSADNVNASLPLFITNERGLGFIGKYYVPAGAGSYRTSLLIPGTEHRADGLSKVQVNPQTTDNLVRKGDIYEIRDAAGGDPWIFDDDTVLIEHLPCYDDGCAPMVWMERYLENPAYKENPDSPYNYGGFAQGDILTMLVDKDRHVSVLQSITYWD